MVAKVDYKEIPIPQEKQPKEYTYNERRAEILQLIKQKGHPYDFNYSELGRRYGVSHEQIRKDFKKLKEYYKDNIGEDAKVTSDIGYKKIIQEHIDNGDLEKARRALNSWNQFLFDIGEQEKEPDKHEISGEGGGPIFIHNKPKDSNEQDTK